MISEFVIRITKEYSRTDKYHVVEWPIQNTVGIAEDAPKWKQRKVRVEEI